MVHPVSGWIITHRYRPLHDYRRRVCKVSWGRMVLVRHKLIDCISGGIVSSDRWHKIQKRKKYLRDS